jgi:hypothetical protein
MLNHGFQRSVSRCGNVTRGVFQPTGGPNG